MARRRLEVKADVRYVLKGAMTVRYGITMRRGRGGKIDKRPKETYVDIKHSKLSLQVSKLECQAKTADYILMEIMSVINDGRVLFKDDNVCDWAKRAYKDYLKMINKII